MKGIRRLAWVALVLGVGHIVFGAIVRITGSGLGCGDHWPKCHGYWFPPLNRIDLIIEVSHRYFAATLSAAIVSLLVLTFTRRRLPGVSGPHGVLRPVSLGAALVIAAALFGAVVVKLELTNKTVIVTHLAIAMSLLAALVVAILRAGGPPQIPEYAAFAGNALPSSRTPNQSVSEWVASAKTARGAAWAAAIAFSALVLGALTAHVPGANTACAGFPLCRGGVLPTDPSQHVQFIHRLIAFALFFHLMGLTIATSKRGEKRMSMLARICVGLCLAQILVAAVMVELQLPPVWRSLHEAVGTALWIAVFFFALVARRTSQGGEGSRVRSTPPHPTLVGAEVSA
ncbi:MAG: COX15/CtaA family protein [Gemmatimonadaceae bacterium]